MKKHSVFTLMAFLLFTSQQATDTSKYDDVGIIVTLVGKSACDGDTDMHNDALKAIAIKAGKKKLHQFKKKDSLRNRINYKNQTAANLQGIYFRTKLFFGVYSGERAYLLTGGDERCSC